MPLAPSPTARDLLQASRLASCLPSKTARVGDVTPFERPRTGPVQSCRVNQTGREGCREGSQQPSPRWARELPLHPSVKIVAPLSVHQNCGTPSVQQGLRVTPQGHPPRPSSSPRFRQNLQPSKNCHLEPSGETDTDGVRRRMSLPISSRAWLRRRQSRCAFRQT